MFKSLAVILAVALVASANQDYKSNRMKLLTQTVSARLHGEALPSDQPQFKAVSRTKNLQASIPQGSQLQFQPQPQFQSQPQFVSQQFGTQMPMSQQQQFVPQFQAPSMQQQQQQQRAPSAMEQAQLQQQLQKQQQIQQQQQQINAQKAVQDQQVLQQQQQLIHQQQQQQNIITAQPQQQVVSQQVAPVQPQQQQPQFIVSPDASSISGAQAPISPLQQQQLMQQQQQQQLINSQQQSQIPQLQQQQNAQLQQQIQQQQRVPQPIAPITQQFTAPQQQQQQVQPQFVAPQPQQFTAPQQQQFVPQQQQQFVQQQAPQFQQTFQQQQAPISSTGLAQTCSTAQPGDLIAHPASPSSFIICYGFGEFTVMDCPEHLVFNAHTQRCDLTTEVPMGCASNPCANNGRCTDIALGQFRCECPIGFAGQHCDRIDACSANTCGGDGVCIALPAGSPVPNACMCNGGRSIGVNCASAEANPCIQPNSNLRLFSVNFNPSLFAHCEGARPNFMFCQAPLIFNAAKQSCDWPSRK